jgi:chitinase
MFKSLFLGFLSVFSTSCKLATYWADNPSNISFPLEMIPSWIDTVIIGFATVNLDSTVAFPYNQTMIQNGIKTLKANNQTVFLSVGGAANCGPKGISQDLMFGFPGFNATIWAKSLANLMGIYGFVNLDIDYECRDGVLQNPANVRDALFELKSILPNITVSFVAFSVVLTPSGWQDYKQAFIAIQPFVDIVFWASYNINMNQGLASAFYSSANITSIAQLGYNLTGIYYGYCLGNGCVWGTGPSSAQVILWANSVKLYGGGGLFLWSLQDELALYHGNFSLFNTMSLSKQVADILHG